MRMSSRPRWRSWTRSRRASAETGKDVPICPVNCRPCPRGIHTVGGYYSVAVAAGAVGSGIIGGVDERTKYVVEKEITTRDEAAKACAAVLEVLRPALRFAAIDAYSDYNDQMPPDVAEAGKWLRQRGSDRRSGDPGMAVEVPVSDDGWEVLCRYVPWSIHV